MFHLRQSNIISQLMPCSHKSCLVKHVFKLSSRQIVRNEFLSPSNLVTINAYKLKLTLVFCKSQSYIFLD